MNYVIYERPIHGGCEYVGNNNDAGNGNGDDNDNHSESNRGRLPPRSRLWRATLPGKEIAGENIISCILSFMDERKLCFLAVLISFV